MCPTKLQTSHATIVVDIWQFLSIPPYSSASACCLLFVLIVVLCWLMTYIQNTRYRNTIRDICWKAAVEVEVMQDITVLPWLGLWVRKFPEIYSNLSGNFRKFVKECFFTLYFLNYNHIKINNKGVGWLHVKHVYLQTTLQIFVF